ncbi:hypothetical protein DL768_004852 [Monosporascus sp. mg162]|nr:hypothetical protein DL768_004852 [Monosporascus sp. mg162]
MNAPDRRKRDDVNTDDEIAAPGDFKRRRLGYEDHDGHLGRIRERNLTRLSHDDYTVGWICALHIEMAAAEAMLDNVHGSLPKNPNDSNTYTVGSIGRHNIVIAGLPANGYGTNNAATVANNMDRTFPSIRVRLMVGIGGGVPGKADVRLGDVVVSTEVWQHDMGKTMQDGSLHRTGTPRRPPSAGMTAVTKLRSNHELKPSRIPSILSEMFQRNPRMSQYVRPSSLPDRLFDSGYDHIESMSTCDHCDESKLLERSPRDNNNPKIHYGVIASGNQVMKDGKMRDQLAEGYGILCFEMEAAGLMDSFPCLVIRGICDYSDSHKNKQWQEYAAATAAAYAKELLSVIHPTDTQRTATITIPPPPAGVTRSARSPTERDIRHYPHIDIPYGRQLILEDQVGHGQDLERYVRNKLTTGTGKFVEKIGTEILQKAAGVFMWAVLVVGILNKEFSRGRKFAVKKRLQEIPAKLSELFKDILTRDNENMADLLLCIQWILYAKRPLQCAEFYFAVVSGLEPEQATVEWNPEYISIADMRLFVLSSSKGLAEVTRSKDQTVQFIHESVPDFLIKDNGLYELWPDLTRDFPSISHDRLKQCCYTYMQMHTFNYVTYRQELPMAVSRGFPLLEYATRNVLYHADMAATGLPQGNFFKAFNLGSWISLHNFFEGFGVRRYIPSTCILYVLAEANLARLIKPVLHYDPEEFHKQGNRYQYALFAALANGHRDAVIALLQLEHNPLKDDITAHLKYGRDFEAVEGQTPLLWAARNGYTEIVQLLLDSGAKIGAKDKYGRTPLSWAARNRHKKIVQLLLDSGADADVKDNNSRTLLWRAAENGHKEIVQLLLDGGAKIDVKDNDSRTPLWRAAENGHKEIVQLLLNRGANAGIDAKDNDSWPPLLWAARNGHKEIVQLLLDSGADANVKDNYGQTPLSWAAEKGHKEIVQLLLDNDAKTDAKDNNDSQTPLLRAAEKGHKEIVQLLLHNDAKTDTKDNDSGQTPLSWAAEMGHKEIVQLLLDNDAKTNAKDNDNRTPLSWAAENGHKEIVQLLLDEGAEIDAKDNFGQTPLQWAAGNGHKEIVQLLLDKGAESDAKDNFGWTPLSKAAEKGHKEIVQLLLNKDAEADSKANDGWTPLS